MILCLSDLWPPFPGGAERLMFNLARDLMRRGYPIRVVTGYENARRLDGPPVLPLPLQVGDQQPIGAAMLADVLAEVAPRVILTHHLYAHQFCRELVATGVPLVQVVLNGGRIPEAALAVYISRWVRDTAGDAQPQDLVLTPPAFPDVVADTHGEHVGFIKPIPHKGVDLVYRLARALPRRRFLILRGEWQDLEDIRPARNVTFMEPVEDIRDFYRQCRVVLMPSRSEDAGTVAQEATANGIPCVSSNVGGLAETNAGGVLLDTWRTAPWVQALQRLDDPREYAEVVARQRAHLEATNHTATLDQLAEQIGRWL